MPIETLLPNIKAANQIYFNQLSEITALREINAMLDLESGELRMSLAVCQKDWKTSDELIQTLHLRMDEKNSIIAKQGKIIKFTVGLVAASLGYNIYKQVK